MCNKLRILPSEYKDNSKKIYKYFIEKRISLNYCSRILSVLNRWGKFQSKITHSFYDNVPLPRGNEQSRIAQAQQTKRGKETELGVRTESLPLSPEILESAKSKFSTEQYNWLKLSVWFGLRPEEVDSLKDSKCFRVDYNLKTKIKVLHIYQSKLQSVAEDKRWKKVPIIFDEQEDCIDIVKNGSFERPLHKTVRKYAGKGITLYGGRKNFVDMMLDKGQRLEDISLWLGHKDISTTWGHYKNRDVVNFVPTEKTKKS
jgi:integrase